MAEKNYSGAEGVEKIQELIKDVHIAMLTTVAEDGSLRARPMANPSRPFDGTLWFITRVDSGKTDEIRHDSEVLVSYAEPKDGKYIALSGKARIVRDREQIHEHWTPAAKAWFPEGESDPAAALIQVSVESAEYWDANRSTIVRVAKLALATVTGADKTSVGDSGKITV